MASRSKVSIKTPETATCVEFSPYKDSSELLAIGCKSRVIVKAWPMRDPTLSEPGRDILESFPFENLFAVSCGSDVRVSNFSWSPLTSYSGDVATSKFVFSVSGVERSIVIYNIDNCTTSSIILPGHMSYVNDLCHHPTDPTILASVGDDGVCRLWDIATGQQRSKFTSTSPFVSVKWHPDDPLKLLVAERKKIRLYDISTAVAIQSLDTPTPPLMSADWCPANSLRVGGVCADNWSIWDLSNSSQPLMSKSVAPGYANKFRWCRQSEGVFATIALTTQVKVHHIGHQRLPQSYDLPIASDLSWHARLPILGVASDEHVHLWTTET